jgi:hypothetical protein
MGRGVAVRYYCDLCGSEVRREHLATVDLTLESRVRMMLLELCPQCATVVGGALVGANGARRKKAAQALGGTRPRNRWTAMPAAALRTASYAAVAVGLFVLVTWAMT